MKYLLLFHILLLESVFVWTREGLVKQSITALWTGLLIYGCYALLKSAEKKQRLMRMTVCDTYADTPLKYKGIDYYGASYHSSKNFTAVSTLYTILSVGYTLLLLYVVFILYRQMLSNDIARFIFTGAHVFLVVPMFTPFTYLMHATYYFTDTCLIVNRTLTIPYAHIKKYQWLKHTKGGYILDLNTGQHFARLIISEADQPHIEGILGENAPE